MVHNHFAKKKQKQKQQKAVFSVHNFLLKTDIYTLLWAPHMHVIFNVMKNRLIKKKTSDFQQGIKKEGGGDKKKFTANK